MRQLTTAGQVGVLAPMTAQRRKRSSELIAAGKVALAAIVHHETICSQSATFETAKAAEEKIQVNKGTQSKQTAAKTASKNTHDDNDGNSKSKSKQSKFGKLFSKKKQTLIDSAKECNEHWAPTAGNKSPPKSGNFVCANQEQVALGFNGNDEGDDDMNDTANSQVIDREQVVEFKFDLIVDRSQGESEQTNGDHDSPLFAGNQQAAAAAMKCSALNDNVNEMVESFVLDSNDVCLMSIGKQRQQHLNKLNGYPSLEQQERQEGEFDYLSQLARHSLAYCFKLLEARRAGIKGQSMDGLDGVEARGGSKVTEEMASNKLADNYSLELSATLFLRQQHIDSPDVTEAAAEAKSKAGSPASAPPTQFSIINLLATDCSSGVDDSTGVEQQVNCDQIELAAGNKGQQPQRQQHKQQTYVEDCSSLEAALEAFERIQIRLKQATSTHHHHHYQGNNSSSKLLIVSFKLKQRINGGSFSNRMCLIDFDSKFKELHSILESIFNGQALAHLKRRKLHLQALESSLIGSGNSSSLSEDELTKQHHQVASQNKLIQAEWLLYKQLSSALIRTLIIVHVHKLALVSTLPDSSMPSSLLKRKPSSLTVAQQLEYEQNLMADNLLLLEFARSIQRASAIRLKRRKRNLKSHHLTSSNVSVASNCSATTNTNQPLQSIEPLSSLHLASSPLFRFRQQQQSHQNRHHRHHHSHQNRYHDHYTTRRKASMDMSLALARHHHRNRHHHHHHQLQQQYPQHHQDRYYQTYRTLQSERQSGSCFTESSSMSTSSGSQVTRQIRSARSSRAATHKHLGDAGSHSTLLQQNNNFSDDSDSVTSANLNSCSSSSYNNKNNSANKSHRTQDSVELRWMSTGCRQSPKRRNLNNHTQISPSSPAGSQSGIARGRRSSSISRVMSSRESSVIQIDCQQPICRRVSSSSGEEEKTINGLSGSLRLSDKTVPDGGDKAADEFADDNTDNVSDICSVVVAEPPKQLKLEQFLNQLSSIIAPKMVVEDPSPKDTLRADEQSSVAASKEENNNKGIRQQVGILSRNYVDGDKFQAQPNCMGDSSDSTTSQVNGSFQPNIDNRLASVKSCSNGNNNNNEPDEDEEDCKSHSSILEHLSSLALESSARFNNRQQQHKQFQYSSNDLQPQQLTFEDEGFFPPPPLECPRIMLDAMDGDSLLNQQTIVGGQQQHQQSKTGHLQQLLNSSLQFRRSSNNANQSSSRVSIRDPSNVESCLRAISISCQAADLTTSSSASCSPSSQFTSSNGDSPSCSLVSSILDTNRTITRTTANTGNHNSSNSSSSSPSVTNPLASEPTLTNNNNKQNLYASVIRNQRHQNVKT